MKNPLNVAHPAGYQFHWTQAMAVARRTAWTMAVFAAGSMVLLGSFSLATKAGAHDAPSGWAYPPTCCSGNDCDEIPASAVTETRYGYHVELGPNDHVALGPDDRFSVDIAETDSRVRDSPDGRYHICITPITDDFGKRVGSFFDLQCFFRPAKLL